MLGGVGRENQWPIRAAKQYYACNVWKRGAARDAGVAIGGVELRQASKSLSCPRVGQSRVYLSSTAWQWAASIRLLYSVDIASIAALLVWPNFLHMNRARHGSGCRWIRVARVSYCNNNGQSHIMLVPISEYLQYRIAYIARGLSRKCVL